MNENTKNDSKMSHPYINMQGKNLMRGNLFHVNPIHTSMGNQNEEVNSFYNILQENKLLREHNNKLTQLNNSLLIEISQLKLEIDMLELRKGWSFSNSFPRNLDSYGSGSYSSYFPYSTSYQKEKFHETKQNHDYDQSAYSPSNFQHQMYVSNAPLSVAPNHYNNYVNNTKLIKYGSNTELSKRGRNNCYELSQDLIDKQIELLERKYGGRRRAQKAALIIQRALRRYMLNKKFDSIRASMNYDMKLSKSNYNQQVQSTSMEMQDDHSQSHNIGMDSLQNVSTSSCNFQNYSVEPSSVSIQNRDALTHHQPYIGAVQEPFTYNVSPQKLQYHENSSSAISNVDRPNLMKNMEFDGQNQPIVTHYTASQIYMRPKMKNSPQYQQSNSRLSTSIDEKLTPPEISKRSFSISSTTGSSSNQKYNEELSRLENHGSLQSVQSSGSDKSASIDKIDVSDNFSDRYISPMYKCKGDIDNEQSNQLLSSISKKTIAKDNYHISEIMRKRKYRIGLNLFNKKPERGIEYLVRNGFLEKTPLNVAKFLTSRKGLSRQMIGEYLGMIQNQFNMSVLECFCEEIDLSGTAIDVALRKFQSYFRIPGEAQKIERLMQIFSQRYAKCNPEVVSKFKSVETVFIISFAIIMLNTDLHTKTLKPERRMSCEDFVRNLRGVDDCRNIDRQILVSIYDRIRANEFKPAADHVSQVLKVQATIIGKKPSLALPYRRLVCYCRLYEIPDIKRKERTGVHQREVFLFNDILVVTKIFNKKKTSVTYTFRECFSLPGLTVTLLKTPNYQHCLQLSHKVDNKVLITFNARNEHDRFKFAQDLEESIAEMDEMEQIRIEHEFEKKTVSRCSKSSKLDCRRGGYDSIQRKLDSDASDQSLTTQERKHSNSLVEINGQFSNESDHRRASICSLDSGTSLTYFSSSRAKSSKTLKDRKQSTYDTSHQNKDESLMTFSNSEFGRSTEV